MLFFVEATVSLFVLVLVLAVSALIAKRHASAGLRKLPGPKPSILFGNALQMDSEADGKFRKICAGQLLKQIHIIYVNLSIAPCLGLQAEIINALNENSKRTPFIEEGFHTASGKDS